MLALIFWISLAGIAASYIAYPLCLLAFSRFGRVQTGKFAEDSVTLVISAYNEGTVIREKLENSLQLDYPNSLLEVMVVSDASDDVTDDIVRSFSDRGVSLYRQEPRAGKSAGLTRFVPLARGEILVFSDANSMYEPDAVRKLVRHFADPAVGFVSGHQRYVADGNVASESESIYWRYETWMKVLESRVGSVVCGDGAIYAIRSELFEPLAADDINDFTLPLKIIIRGYRGVFDPEAVCYEHAASDIAGEFWRRVRIVNRSFRAVCRNWRALSPLHVGWFAVQLLVHKVIRWFVPFLMVLVLITNIALVAAGAGLFFQCFLGLQAICYFLASLYVIPPFRRFRPVYVCYYFCVANAAAGLGILSFLVGKRYQIWTTVRDQQSELETASFADGSELASVTSLGKPS